jgi:hypothetical protein
MENATNEQPNNGAVPSATTTFRVEASSATAADKEESQQSRPGLHRAFSIPTNADERLHVANIHGHGSKRHKILHFLHSKPVEYTLLSLLMFDLVILMLEMFISAEFPHCSITERNAISCCPIYDESAGQQRWLASDSHEAKICQDSLVASPEYPVGCDDHKYPWLHTLHVAFFSITVSILGTFFIEMMLMIFCLGCVFFKHFFYVLDLFVVSVSLVLEITLYTLNDDILATLTGLLVILRLWRFVRVGHGIVEATVELSQKRFDKVVRFNEQLEGLIKEHDIDIPQDWLDEMHKLKSLDPWFSEE